MTNTEKKQYLGYYRHLQHEIGRLVNERQELMTLALHVTSTISGMPKAQTDGSRIENAVTKIYELDQKIGGSIEKMVKIREEIEARISKVEDPTLRRILRLRYIDGKTWEKIAVETNYTWRHVLRLHGAALYRFE